MVVEYLITIKTLNHKKTKKESTKIQNIFFVFCTFNSFDSGDRQMIYTSIIKYRPLKIVLFVETTKLFVSNSVRVYRHICVIF